MDRHQILCIQKSFRNSPHERIEFIGGLNSNGTRWKITQARAIQGIEEGKWQFYVNQNGYIVNVIIGTHLGNKYLKTQNDGLGVNNLLNLSECP